MRSVRTDVTEMSVIFMANLVGSTGNDHGILTLGLDHDTVLQGVKLVKGADIILYRPPRTHMSFICKAIYDLMIEIMGEQPSTTGTRGFKWIMVLEFLLVMSSGVFHAVAWNSHFPSIVEKWLWRLSSIGICVTGFAVFVIGMSTKIDTYLLEILWERGQSDSNLFRLIPIVFHEGHKVARRHAQSGKSKIFNPFSYFWMWIILIVGVNFVLLYWYCVCFITIESYLSMRSPLPKHFITPTWTNYLPHL